MSISVPRDFHPATPAILIALQRRLRAEVFGNSWISPLVDVVFIGSEFIPPLFFVEVENEGRPTLIYTSN